MITKKSKVKKTPEQIMQANLRKMLGKLKTGVANTEEYWLEMFSELINLQLGKEEKLTLTQQIALIHDAGILADTALQVYEERWGEMIARED